MHLAPAVGIYVCNTSTHAQTCPCSSSALYGNEFLHYLRIANTQMHSGSYATETRQRARQLTLGRECVQQTRSRQTEQQSERTRQLDRDRRRQARQCESDAGRYKYLICV